MWPKCNKLRCPWTGVLCVVHGPSPTYMPKTSSTRAYSCRIQWPIEKEFCASSSESSSSDQILLLLLTVQRGGAKARLKNKARIKSQPSKRHGIPEQEQNMNPMAKDKEKKSLASPPITAQSSVFPFPTPPWRLQIHDGRRRGDRTAKNNVLCVNTCHRTCRAASRDRTSLH